MVLVAKPLTLLTFLAALPILHLIPLRTTFIILGLAPFAFTHPHTRDHLLPTPLAFLQTLTNASDLLVANIRDRDPEPPLLRPARAAVLHAWSKEARGERDDAALGR